MGGGGEGGGGGGGCGFDHACREMSLVVGGDRTDFLFNLIRSLSLLPSLNHYYNNHYHSLLVALTDSLRYQHQQNSSSSLVPPPPHPFPSLPPLFSSSFLPPLPFLLLSK